MTQVGDFILMHAQAPYDPVKRHQYYEEHKQLKGRKTGTSTMPSGGSGGRSSSPGPSLHAQANQAASDVRVQAIREKLTALHDKLRELLAQAAQEDAKTATSTSSSTKSGGSSTSEKPMTAKEKADAREASQKYRDKHKNDNPTPAEKPTVGEQVAKVRATIKKYEDQLRAAIAAAQDQTATGR